MERGGGGEGEESECSMGIGRVKHSRRTWYKEPKTSMHVINLYVI